MTKTYLLSMKIHVMLMAAMVTLLTSNVGRADAFDEKASAVAAQESQAAQSRAHAASYRALTTNNASIVGRVPRGATITECYNRYAFIFRNWSNGCSLANIEWNGIPVQICTEGYNENLPPEIVSCHYHVAATGSDCEIVRNATIKPRCY